MLFDNVYQLCLEAQVSIAKLEKQLGFANGTIGKWKKSQPGADKLEKVANYFNVSIDSLLGRDTFAVSDAGLAIANQYDQLTAEQRALLERYLEGMLSVTRKTS